MRCWSASRTRRGAGRPAARIVVDYGNRHRALGIGVGVHTATTARRGDESFGGAANFASQVANLAEL